MAQGLRVLVLSRNYPNNVMPQLGMWVEGLVRHLRPYVQLNVVAPVPYCPPVPRWSSYAAYRAIDAHREDGGTEVWHPRILLGPGQAFHRFESSTYYAGVARLVERIYDQFPFDLIHAHFVYPDGVVAERLGRRFGVPVVITEHARWIPWMHDYPDVRRQAVRASRRCALHMAVSRHLKDMIISVTEDADSNRFRVVPVGVDETVFRPDTNGSPRNRNQVLFVGRIHRVKGVDVLLKALRSIVDRRPEVRLVIAGGGFLYRGYRRQEQQIRTLVEDFGLTEHVSFVGHQRPLDVARLMRTSGVVVLPSRAETFGAVLVESLACGTPVVATRCGGPEEIVTADVGVLVPPEDPDALADAIERVLHDAHRYDPRQLSDYAIQNFAWDKIARRTVELYREAIDSHPTL